jgi:hypothetical protein
MAAHAVLSPLRLMRRKNQESERQWSGFCMSKAGGRIESFACMNDADRHRAAKAPSSTFYWRLPASMLRQGFRQRHLQPRTEACGIKPVGTQRSVK